jgi:hypothetical protein
MTAKSPPPGDVGGFLSEIKELAAREGLPVAYVQRLYAAEMERLRTKARIFEFVPVLAANQLKRRLRAKVSHEEQL